MRMIKAKSAVPWTVTLLLRRKVNFTDILYVVERISLTKKKPNWD